MDTTNRFEISLSFGKNPVAPVQEWVEILEVIANSFLPQADAMRLLESPLIPVSGASDTLVQQAVESERMIELSRKDETLKITFTPFHRLNLLIAVHKDIIQDIAADTIKEFLQEMIHTWPPMFAQSSLYQASQRVLNEYYLDSPRTRRAPGLVWLQYYGPEEFELQGGKKIFENPYISAHPLKDGILIEVGDGPFDSVEPEGEEFLVKATQAMPPIQS